MSARRLHDLKCWPQPFEAILRGEKVFELRNNDRDFRDGEYVLLREWTPATPTQARVLHEKGRYSGREIKARIGYVVHVCDWFTLDDSEVDGPVVFSLLDVRTTGSLQVPTNLGDTP